MQWQVQEAKQRFSQLVQRAIDEGPQVVTRHGRDVVVVVAADEFRRLTSNKTSTYELSAGYERHLGSTAASRQHGGQGLARVDPRGWPTRKRSGSGRDSTWD